MIVINLIISIFYIYNKYYCSFAMIMVILLTILVQVASVIGVTKLDIIWYVGHCKQVNKWRYEVK